MPLKSSNNNSIAIVSVSFCLSISKVCKIFYLNSYHFTFNYENEKISCILRPDKL